MTDQTKTKMIDPAELTLHPLLKGLPGLWEQEDERLLRLTEDVMAHGVLEPLKVTAGNEIVDGRHRWMAARRGQLQGVPCQAIDDDQVVATIISTVVHRRHLTKSALAYILYPLVEGVHQEAIQAHWKRVRSGNKGTISHGVGYGPIESIAQQIGVSRALLDYAAEVHEIFREDPEYKAQMEPRILAHGLGGEHEKYRPVGLGAVVSGWAGKQRTVDRPRPDHGPLHLFSRTFRDLANRVGCWEKLEAEERREARGVIRSSFEQLPAELVEEFAQAARAELKRRKEEEA